MFLKLRVMAQCLLGVLAIFALSTCVTADVQNAVPSIPPSGASPPTGFGGQQFPGITVGSAIQPYPTTTSRSASQGQSLDSAGPLTATGHFPWYVDSKEFEDRDTKLE